MNQKRLTLLLFCISFLTFLNAQPQPCARYTYNQISDDSLHLLRKNVFEYDQNFNLIAEERHNYSHALKSFQIAENYHYVYNEANQLILEEKFYGSSFRNKTENSYQANCLEKVRYSYLNQYNDSLILQRTEFYNPDNCQLDSIIYNDYDIFLDRFFHRKTEFTYNDSTELQITYEIDNNTSIQTGSKEITKDSEGKVIRESIVPAEEIGFERSLYLYHYDERGNILQGFFYNVLDDSLYLSRRSNYEYTYDLEDKLIRDGTFFYLIDPVSNDSIINYSLIKNYEYNDEGILIQMRELNHIGFPRMIRFIYPEEKEGFEKSLNEPLLNIYPNPTSDQLTIFNNGIHLHEKQIRFFDMSGKECNPKIVFASNLLIQYSLRDLPKGNYILYFENERTSISQIIAKF